MLSVSVNFAYNTYLSTKTRTVASKSAADLSISSGYVFVLYSLI